MTACLDTCKYGINILTVCPRWGEGQARGVIDFTRGWALKIIYVAAFLSRRYA